MGETSENKPRKHICTALLAHVDAGKTTLSEAMLYLSGSIRKIGRVDNQDAYLDNYDLERQRGITIFSKQAELLAGETEVTLLDTPGHVDFSAEMERTLQVLDYAVLLISGADGIQGHTKTLWRLLKRYEVPTFLFINKMDQQGTDKEALLSEIRTQLGDGCVDFSKDSSGNFCDRNIWENISVCDETVLEYYLEQERVEQSQIRRLIRERKLFPCFFGSALKSEGVDTLMEGIDSYTEMPDYPAAFGAKVFKITRDSQGNRLTHMKITGGTLKVRENISGYENHRSDEKKEAGGADDKNAAGSAGREKSAWTEKVNQIRIYSGEKYETVNEVAAGGICAVTGLTRTYPGEGIGGEAESELPILEPVLNYELELPEGVSPQVMLPKLRMLEEEEPELHIVWDEALQEIKIQMMGEVQTEVLKHLIKERFGVEVSFGAGKIVYKETIADTVEGVGHFEPLRHYAEVHLLLEPGERGSGLTFGTDCSEDILDRNWQRLVLTHLEEKEHVGVLTGSPITDMKITLVTGRAHNKHTEGGDFRQATYRALRQGLMQAQSVLLEPYYEFRLEIPEDALGRAMTDMERMKGTCNPPELLMGTGREGKRAVLTGRVPVAALGDYAKEVTAYSKGHGSLSCTLWGYEVCHNQEEVVERIGYDPERDTANPTGSVFCAHGAGFVVEWDLVKDYMHMESVRKPEKREKDAAFVPRKTYMEQKPGEERWIGTEEIDSILNQTYNANRRKKGEEGRNSWKLKGRSEGKTVSAVTRTYQPKPQKEEYLLVDGYNVIFAWQQLKELAAVNIDSARGKLLDILSNYQGIRGCHLIVVFDAYRVQGHKTELFDYHNIHVVYTKEAETADAYIEKFAHENGRKYRVTVATSDGLEQIIIRGAGCLLLSARDLEQEIAEKSRQIQKDYQENAPKGKSFLLDNLSAAAAEELQKLGEESRREEVQKPEKDFE
ncbi:MAG: TetM/TetW/TetO/TetS family tetracycline resistance ribosomal protection protein [Roseburia sp.]|nr:TetM/TetW/TetO/TetS family tetracycline resistance ribosomal protection protein [Roseburia sp.]